MDPAIYGGANKRQETWRPDDGGGDWWGPQSVYQEAPRVFLSVDKYKVCTRRRSEKKTSDWSCPPFLNEQSIKARKAVANSAHRIGPCRMALPWVQKPMNSSSTVSCWTGPFHQLERYENRTLARNQPPRNGHRRDPSWRQMNRVNRREQVAPYGCLRGPPFPWTKSKRRVKRAAQEKPKWYFSRHEWTAASVEIAIGPPD